MSIVSSPAHADPGSDKPSERKVEANTSSAPSVLNPQVIATGAKSVEANTAPVSQNSIGAITQDNRYNQGDPSLHVFRSTVQFNDKPDFDLIAHLKKVRKEAIRVAVVAQVLNGVDGIATLSCLAAGSCIELNPVFGSGPSPAKMLSLKSSVGLFQFTTMKRESDTDPYRARSDAYAATFQHGLVALLTMGAGL